jgi:uncharacterized protein (TIGR03435 family)
MLRGVALLVVALAIVPILSAQTPRAEFDVVSIKRSPANAGGGGMRTLPDGTSIMTNVAIRQFINSAAPVPVREVRGLPEWAEREHYDVTAKPPEGSTREQRAEMWQTLFADRMKLVAHVEEAERDTFALVVARSDGRLGPQLKKSALDCSPRPPSSPPPSAPPPGTFDPQNAVNRCGGFFGPGVIISGGMKMDQLVLSLSGLAGRLVNNRTGLEGDYAFTLKFSRSQPSHASPDAPLPDDPPEFFTALQEQLGLKLQPEKTIVPVFVIDHIERPSEN